MRRKCFVVMPFGQKLHRGETRERNPIDEIADKALIDFDAVYDKLIVPVVAGGPPGELDSLSHLDMECVRSDKWNRSGSIHKEMFEHLLESDVVIVDITTHNANVFYELGIRHSFRQHTTVLIRREGERIPFNITSARVVDYNIDTPAKLDASRRQLLECIRDSFHIKDNDSLVHEVLRDVRISRPSVKILERRIFAHTLTCDQKKNKKIGFITGDILNVDCIDVWVNAENTKMQMARYHDGSVSSNIRYFGAKLRRNGFVHHDTIDDALRRQLRASSHVEPGTVLATTAGRLGSTNRLRMVLHVAAMHGVPGRGYEPVHNIEHCVWGALEYLDNINRRWWSRPALRHPLDRPRVTTILFPLFGVRSGQLEPQSLADLLFRSAAVYFENEPQTTVEHVYFLAYTETDQRLCEGAIGTLARLGKLAKVGPVDHEVGSAEVRRRVEASEGVDAARRS